MTQPPTSFRMAPFPVNMAESFFAEDAINFFWESAVIHCVQWIVEGVVSVVEDLLLVPGVVFVGELSKKVSRMLVLLLV